MTCLCYKMFLECFSYWRGIVPTDCARRNPLKKWKCYFGEHVYKTDSASPKHGKFSLNPLPLYICRKKIRGSIARIFSSFLVLRQNYKGTERWWEQQDQARDHNDSLPKVMEPLYLKLFPHGPHSF